MSDAGTPLITWGATDSNNGEYTIADIADIAKGANQATASESLLILPQNTDNLKVTFTATLTDADDVKIAEGNFEAPLDIDGDAQASNWKPGYRYNYTATLNGGDVPVYPTDPEDPDAKPKKIEFSNVTVDEWENSNPDTNPTTPVIPKP